MDELTEKLLTQSAVDRIVTRAKAQAARATRRELAEHIAKLEQDVALYREAFRVSSGFEEPEEPTDSHTQPKQEEN